MEKNKKKKAKTKYGTVSLPMPLIDKIKERINGTGMTSVSSYVAFVMRQVISLEDDGEVFSKKQEEEIKERLKRLGYY